MTQEIVGVNNYTDVGSGRNSLEDFGVMLRSIVKHEGIIEGLRVTETSPLSAAVRITPGSLAINGSNAEFMIFRSKIEETALTVPNTGIAKNYLVVFKVDITNVTAEMIVIEGTTGTDPSLSEGGDPEVYYLVLARIAHTGASSNVTDDEIIQDGKSLTNNGDNETIGRFAGQDGWRLDDSSFSFGTPYQDPIYILESPGDLSSKYSPGMRIKLDQSEPYTNDPASGSNIILNMSDTSGFEVGNEVRVSSSAGSEYATITVVTPSTSITVDSLAINHTTTDPLVTATKYFIVVDEPTWTPANGTTAISIYGGTDYNLADAAISNVSYSNVKAPYGFPVGVEKWTEDAINPNITIGNPTDTVWYNLGGYLDIPLGSWRVYYRCALYIEDTVSPADHDIQVTLSTTSNGATDGNFTRGVRVSLSTSITEGHHFFHVENPLVLSSLSTRYYLNGREESGTPTDEIRMSGPSVGVGLGYTSYIRAVCSYL
ncbi:MAG: hypothetical protein ACFFDH_00115 [Promethearchaeota archaeon]